MKHIAILKHGSSKCLLRAIILMMAGVHGQVMQDILMCDQVHDKLQRVAVYLSSTSQYVNSSIISIKKVHNNLMVYTCRN